MGRGKGWILNMTAITLLKAVVDEKKDKLKTLETQLEEFACAGLSKRKEQNELKSKKVRLKAELKNIEQEICQTDLGIQCNALEAQKIQQTIKNLSAELKCASREIDIDAVVQQRKDFYAALTIRLKKLQEDLKDTDVECRNPKEVVEELRVQIESLAVSEYHQLIRFQYYSI